MILTNVIGQKINEVKHVSAVFEEVTNNTEEEAL